MKNITAPRNLKIKGQDHMLAYITAKEAEALKARGGSGRMTKYGVRSYENGDGPGGESGDSSGQGGGDGSNAADGMGGGDGPGAGSSGQGGGDGSNPADGMGAGSMGPDTSGLSDAIGQGFGPESPGYGFSDPTAGFGPGPDATVDDEPDATVDYDTDVVDVSFGVAPNARGLGVMGGILGAATGIPGLGLAGTALGTAVDVNNLNAQLGMMGLNPSVSYGPSLASNLSIGAFGQSPTSQFGQSLGFDALAEAPMSAFSGPPPGQGPTADTGGGSDVGSDGGLLSQVELPSAVGPLQQVRRYQIVNNTIVPVPFGLLG
jgi:hypothetical protein